MENGIKALEYPGSYGLACMHFPEKGAALLELVETIQAMPELEMTEEQKLRFAEEWKEWKYLTVFDNCLTETYERK
jgi:hypothetical protein